MKENMKTCAVNKLISSLLVVLCVVCGIVSAWGADVASVTVNGTTTNYASFSSAWTAAKSASADATITLLQDISGVDMLTYSNTQNCTLDLNGHVLTSNATQAALYITSNVTFTVTDGSENKEGKIGIVATDGNNAYGVLVSNGHFVLNAGTIEAHLRASTSQGVRVANGASFTMNGGTIEVETTNSKNGDGVFANGTATIHGGEIHVRAAATGYAVNVAGTTTITGGKFYATGSSAACVHTNGSGASLTLQGGYYNINTNLDAYCATNYHVFPNSDATYPHKVAEGYTLTWTTDGDPLTGDYTSGLTEVGTTIVAPNTPTKTGYTFAGWSSPVAETMPSANTEYTAQWAVASVTIGNETTLYTNFAAAWAAANSATAASTLTLLQDVTVTTKLTYNNSNNKDCILDLNGHTLTSNTSEQYPLHINNTSVTFTITDGTEEKAGKLSLNTSSSSTIFGVYVQYGTFLLNGGTLEVTSSTATACGVTIHYGTFTMNGGTIHVRTTNGMEGRGIYANSTTTVNGGTVHVEAAGTAYGIRHDTGTMTINDGKFTISGSTASYMNYKANADSKLIIKGGYYTIDTRLGTYVSNPYHIFDLTSGAEFDEGYRYKVAEGYTVTFKNGDVTLQSGLWEKGATPLYSGETLAKAADAQYTYTFNGWSPAVSTVTADVTYTAQFSSTVNKYTITFKNGEEVLQSSEVEDGTMPVYSGSTPTRPADAEYAYTFDGWSPALSAVTADATYTATYTITPVVASVTVNSTTTYYTSFADAWTAANGATAAATLTLLQNVSGLSSSKTYNASHNLMLDLNGHTLSGAGTITSLFQISCTGSTFTMTDGSANHDGKLSFSSESESNSHCVIVNNGTFVLEAGMMEATSSNASIGAVQVVGGTFTMNENGAVHVNYTGNVNSKNSRLVYANGGTTTINGGSIRLESKKDAIGVVYSSGNVTFNGGLFNISASGTAAVTNQNGAKDYLNIRGGYYSANTTTYFEPHVKAPYYVLSNSDATYKYKVVERYTVTFSNYNGTSLQSGLWEKGVTPAYSGSTPTRPADAQYTYTFDGWDADIVPVTGSTTYTAQFSSTVNKYTITFKNGEEVLQSTEVEYGATPAYNGATPTKAATAQYTYLFNGWDAELVPVTGDATYTATYTETLLQAKASVAVGEGEPVGYATFDAAWSAATTAGSAVTVKLLEDVSNVAMLEYTRNHNLTLDLNGHKLTSNAAQAAILVNNAAITFTVTDSSIGKNGKIYINASNTIAAYGVLVSAGNFVLNGGTIEAHLQANTSYGVRVSAGASFSMSDGMIDVVTTNSKNGDGVYVHKSGDNAGSATISGGTVSVKAAGKGYAVEAVGTVTITGGCFYATGSSAACAVSNNDVLVLQGGYYNTNNYLNRYTATPYCVLPNSDATYPYKVAEGYTVSFRNYNNSSLQSGAWEKGATPAYTGATPAKPADEYYTYTFAGWSPEIVAVTANAAYTAQFSTSTRTYTVIWKDGDGNILKTDDNLTYGAMPQYNGTTPTKTATVQCSYVFAGWSPEVVAVTADAVYEASFQSVTMAEEGKTIQIASNSYITTTTVEAGGELVVEDNMTLYTEKLILQATPTSSGEISGNVIATQNADFDFSQPGGFKAHTWYAVAVPWLVDVPAYNKANCGVYTKKGAGSFVQQEMGRTFDLIYYDGARRATGAEKAWNYIEDDAADKHFMYPGRAYMIYLAADADVIRFRKSAGADLHTYEVAVEKHPSGLGDSYANWNGIANPATYKAKLNAGTTADKGQVYNPATGQYELFDLKGQQLQVGQAVFVQPKAAKSVIAEREIQGGGMTGEGGNSFGAPRRINGLIPTPARFEVVLSQEDAPTADRIIVCMDEDKEADEYAVGHDLAKLGISSVVPQMWVNRYNSRLCINTMAGTCHAADYPLGIFAPEAGGYTISIDQNAADESSVTANTMLYLTYDGKPIWNLSYNRYVAELDKGDNSRYGLRIVTHVPQTPTGIEELTVQNGGQVRKVLVDGNIYIIREGHVYSMDGKTVK